MTVLEVLVTVFGVVGGLAVFPQVYKIFKRKSAKDISILTYSLLFIATIFWLLYGIELNNFPILIANTFGGVNIVLIIVGWFLYGREAKVKK